MTSEPSTPDLHELLNELREAVATGSPLSPDRQDLLDRQLRSCLRRCRYGQEIEAVVSNVFTRLWETLAAGGRIPSFESRKAACRYLCRIASNERRSEARHEAAQGRLKTRLEGRVPHRQREGATPETSPPASEEDVDAIRADYRALVTWYVGRVKPTRREPIRRDCDALQAIYDAETTSEVEAQEEWGIAQPNTFQKRLSRARAGLCDAIECLEALGPEQRPEWAHQADLHLLRRYVRLLKR